MSTNKKIRKIYDDTFRNLTQTSANQEKLRQLSNQLKSPSQTMNLPITLADVSIHLFSVRTTSTIASKPSKRKAATNHEIKQPAAKKTRKK